MIEQPVYVLRTHHASPVTSDLSLALPASRFLYEPTQQQHQLVAYTCVVSTFVRIRTGSLLEEVSSPRVVLFFSFVVGCAPSCSAFFLGRTSICSLYSVKFSFRFFSPCCFVRWSRKTHDEATIFVLGCVIMKSTTNMLDDFRKLRSLRYHRA